MGVEVKTDLQTEVTQAVGRSFVITVTCVSLAALLDTFLLAFLVTALR